MTAIYPEPSAALGSGYGGDPHSRMHGRTLGVWENVMAYGADPTGVVDSTSNIQEAIDKLLVSRDGTKSGGTVYFPPGTYKITAPLTIGGDGEAYSESIVLLGAGMGGHSETHSNASFLVYAGTSGDEAILDVFNTHSGGIKNLSFNARNLAERCVRMVFAAGQPAGTAATEHWDIQSCAFIGARSYNFQIGDTDAATEHGDVSLVSFLNCYFRPDLETNAHTTAHVYHISDNALSNNFYDCQFYGNGTYPRNAVLMESGAMYFFGCQSVVLGEVDIKMVTRASHLPPNIHIYGWESQSANFLLYDTTASAANAVRPSVLSGVTHSDITVGAGLPGPGTYTISWNQTAGAWGPLVLEGFKADYDIDFVTTNQNVYVTGVSFHDNGSDFTGAGITSITGSWNTGGIRKFQVAGGLNLVGALAINEVASSRVTGDAAARLQILAGGRLQWGNGTDPSDASLFRTAANTLESDAQLRVTSLIALGGAISVAEAATAVTTAFGAYVTTDTFNRYVVRASGEILWGSGSAGPDTNLQRSAANVLKTDDKFLAALGIGVGNSAAATGPVGTVTHKMEVFDASGASLGFVPIYDAIT